MQAGTPAPAMADPRDRTASPSVPVAEEAPVVDRFDWTPTYGRATSPVYFGAISLAVIIAAIAVNVGLTGRGPFSSTAYTRALSLAAPPNFSTTLLDPYDGTTRLGIVLALSALVMTALWAVVVVRAPRAHPTSLGTLVVAVVGCSTFYAIPFMVGDPRTDEPSELKTRFLIALLFALAVGLAKVILASRVWDASHLPVPVLSLLVSVPGALGSLWLTLPRAIHVVGVDKRRPQGFTFWMLTQGQHRWATLLVAFSAIVTIVMLVVASVQQHREIAAERAVRRSRPS